MLAGNNRQKLSLQRAEEERMMTRPVYFDCFPVVVFTTRARAHRDWENG